MSMRRFEFVEGSSSKFWAIELSGSSFTVNWGRIGTDGQTQTKEFSSDAEAKKQYDKLVAEKLKKGYVETGGGATASPTKAASAPAAKPASKPAATAPAAKADAPAVKSKSKATAEEPAASVPVPAPVVTVNLEVTRTINLSPQDWATAAWRPRKASPRPKPQPFDQAACVAKVAKVGVGTYGWQWKWETAGIPEVMSPQEAHFWLAAMSQAHNKIKPKELAEKLAKQTFDAITGEEALKIIAKKQTSIGPEVLLPLSAVMSIEELVEAMSDPGSRNVSSRAQMPWQDDPDIIFAFQQHLLFNLTDADVEKLRKLIAPQITLKHWPTDHYKRAPAPFFLAAMLGFSDELLPIVQSWKEGFYNESGWDHTHYHTPQYIVLGLGSPAIVEAEMRRHKLPLNKSAYIRGFLACTEYAALDYIRDSILAMTNREECEALLKTFADAVIAPEAAPHMLELKLSSKAPKVAREWLDANTGCAIAGLIPLTATRGKLADAAIEHLRDLKRAGHGDLIKKAAGKDAPPRLREEVIDFVEKTYTPFTDKSTPAWLSAALDGAPRGKAPAWAPVSSLPVLTIGEHRLNDDQVLAVIGALQKEPVDKPGALLKAVREHAAADSRDAFAWRLFESWTAEGAPSKEKWAMGAVGHLGGDASVLRLTPMIRNWPGESQHQRAVFGLECLRAVGSDIALMQLNGIAQKLKFKGLKAKAMEFMESIAATRNMTRSELEDRIVPDCDLDEKGRRIFDFGPRQFRFVLGPDLKAMVKDAEGKVKSDLPSPGAKDDAAKAKDAVETWKLLKKQIREIAKVQAERLEQSMVTGRRWKVADFELLLVKHPLMINFVRLLVWGGYDGKGALKKTFRVTEDQSYADEKDNETTLAGIEQVGIVHPLHLSEAQKNAWGEVMSDYEIVPPFEQVGRPIHGLEKGEEKAKELTRYEKLKIPAAAVVYTLDKLGWTRGAPADGGGFYEHSKPFYAADVTAIVQYEPGVGVGYITEAEDQQIKACLFVPGYYKGDEWYPDHKKRLELGSVDPVVVSEVLKDLMVITSKAK